MDNNLLLSPIPLPELIAQIRTMIKEELAAAQPSPAETENGYLTRKEAAELLSITLPTLQQRILDGTFKAYRVGRRVYLKAAEVDKSMKRIALN